MTTKAPVEVTVWYDYTWPFCYVGLGRLEQIAAETSIAVDRRPYLLNPDKPEEGEPRPRRDGETETGLNPAMQARAEGAGLVMRRPSWSPNTKPAHEATMYAKEQGRDGELHHAIAQGYWEQGVDFGQLPQLKEAAEQSGLDWGQLAPLLESGHYRQQVMDEYAAAKEKGIGVTPTYMVDGELLVGDVSVEDLRAAIDKAGGS